MLTPLFSWSDKFVHAKNLRNQVFLSSNFVLDHYNFIIYIVFFTIEVNDWFLRFLKIYSFFIYLQISLVLSLIIPLLCIFATWCSFYLFGSFNFWFCVSHSFKHSLFLVFYLFWKFEIKRKIVTLPWIVSLPFFVVL